MKSARRSGIAVLHANPVMARSRLPVSEPVYKEPSLTKMDGNAYWAINNLLTLSLEGRGWGEGD